MCKLLYEHDFISLGYIPRGGIAKLYIKYMFKYMVVLGNYHTIFQGGYTILYSHQKYIRIPFSPCS